jgi:putative aminopeptidase FrvX
MHTPVEVLDTEDLKRLAQVLSGFVGQIGKEGAV